ncbi:hypothetical protein ASG47_09390 [Devosia sp. Leaf420]|uniref:hypothetical protein n=1 Tax=Devosia sp. Leaf420 TaxID=1736374 RepID=UPI00071331E1|nr:hypothetical protein [Devosia sp. Leaf420]KQT48545.1 hypothetical protein ASG47_09390 [Devosia sp. Leaf420]
MLKIMTCLTLLVAATTPTLAALPPQYQRQAEFTAVLDAATEALGVSRLIQAIEMTEPDVFVVRSGECSVTVRIVDAPSKREPGWVGPMAFEAKADAVVC